MRTCSFLFSVFVACLLGGKAMAVDAVCERSIRSCCEGVAYWTGLDAMTGKPIQADGQTVNAVAALVRDYNNVGGLRPTEGRDAVITIAATVGLFLVLLGLIWLGARRSRVDGRVLYGALVLVPALAWWFLPQWLAERTASESASAFVNKTLKHLCHESGAPGEVTAGACSPARWANVFKPEETAKGTLATCTSLPVEAEQLLSGTDGEEPCVEVCADAISPLLTHDPRLGDVEVRGYPALKARVSLLERFMSDCDAVATGWRGEEALSDAVWQGCAESLAARNFRRALASNTGFLPLRFGWLGGLFSALASVLLGFLVLRRR